MAPSENTFILTGGRVIDPSQQIDRLADIRVTRGYIETIAAPGSFVDAPEPVIETKGLWIVPGLVDPHVHLRDPGFPQKETILTGLRAAAAGGFTTVAAMANTSPVNDSPEITRYMLEQANKAKAARLVTVSAVTKGLDGKELVNFETMAASGARLFSDDGMPIDAEEILVSALKHAARVRIAISLHEEDRTLSVDNSLNRGRVALKLGLDGIPPEAESARVKRDLELAIDTGAHIHIAHVSTASALEAVRAARRRGVSVTCEVTPHHFTLDELAVAEFGSYAKMNPPLRGQPDRSALLEAIADGTIDMVATDHAPHDPDSKNIDQLAPFFGKNRRDAPLDAKPADAFRHAANGVVGLETALGLAMALVHHKVIGPSRLVEMMSTLPARLLAIDGGTLRKGAPADVTVIDPTIEWTVTPDKFLSKSRNTPFAGKVLRGKSVLTIVAGEIVYDGRRNGQVQ